MNLMTLDNIRRARRLGAREDRVQGDAQQYRDRLRPMVNNAIYEEVCGRAGAKAALALVLREALTALQMAEE